MLSHSEEDTRDIGKQLAAKLHGGDIVALRGDLGAGKTTFVKGLAEGLGVTDDITSPTFTLMNVYNMRTAKNAKLRKLVHIDTYRLNNEQELLDIGAEDYIGALDIVCVIEWPEKVAGLIRDKKIKKITIEHVSENERKITTSFTPAPKSPMPERN